MHVQKVEGIIIKRKNVGEADRIITVFTKTLGKVQIKAVGVRKITSKRSSHIELLNHAHLTIYKGKAMPILTEAQTITVYEDLKSDLGKVGLAYHVCELIDSLCAEHQESHTIFSLLQKILEKISEGGNIVQHMYDFEIELLHELGFYPKNQANPSFNPSYFIEEVLERKLKARPLLYRFR